jgi:hypothetical protein
MPTPKMGALETEEAVTIQGFICISTLDTNDYKLPDAVECVAAYYDSDCRILSRGSATWEDVPGCSHLIATVAPKDFVLYTDRRLAIEAYAREQPIEGYRELALGLLAEAA